MNYRSNAMVVAQARRDPSPAVGRSLYRRPIDRRLDGACSVPSPAATFASPGPSSSGTFYSAARHRTVGYTIAWPPRHRAGDDLPLAVMFHGYGGNHADALVGMSPAQARHLAS